MPDIDRIRLVIAALTFRRPRDIAEVVPALIEEAASVEYRGAAGQARGLARKHPVRYVHAPVFDPRFGISGGSDSAFTRYPHAHGGEIVWCDGGRAMVHAGLLLRGSIRAVYSEYKRT